MWNFAGDGIYAGVPVLQVRGSDTDAWEFSPCNIGESPRGGNSIKTPSFPRRTESMPVLAADRKDFREDR